ncbi:unnamed protein product [Didymodactylos carnosus]|uniref:CDC20/Fizzy WD40 domain-containing protein n=1 Tax=Didymodactylos carnosus TaxID=1234261 RepID=A0A813XLT4_9BILA|nr:unnamed protein product [Didymodactylos carnosus]CAF1058593.1 unnamed protein product [Didymodactylos carnosus]CAF3656214.1 unnamed protein product [Didymodactylos carnosus]CAF3824448.1 unnamed protein product [Didymodactylos carnosus]
MATILTPQRPHVERTQSQYNFNFPKKLFLNPFDDDEDFDEKSRTEKSKCDSTSGKAKAWSVRARRDVPNLLRGDRYIPRRIDLDCDFALDMLITNTIQNRKQQVKQEQELRNFLTTPLENRHINHANNNSDNDNHNNNQNLSQRTLIHPNSAKKALELLDHFMPQNKRILNFGVKTLKPKVIAPCDLARQLQTLTFTTKERYISSTPERILDAPDLIDDFYLNLIDWGNASNMIAVALMNCVFLWDDSNGSVTKLLELDADENTDDANVHYASSVAWHQRLPLLAVGTSHQEVMIYDVQQKTCKRKLLLQNLLEDDDRIPSLAWNQNVIACGTRNNGEIIIFDIRQKVHVTKFRRHYQEVCGLKWCPNGRYLTSGSNDNAVCVWDFNQWHSNGAVNSSAISSLVPLNNDDNNNNFIQNSERTKPLWHFKQHNAAVKALAWCPWQPTVLCTGGGHSDGYLRFWNINNGVCLHAVKTESQVSSILWSSDYKELITGQGHPNNFLDIWHYPSMEKCHTLKGHTSRILSTIMGPKGNPVVSLSADETIRFWNCFPIDLKRKKQLDITRTHSYPTMLNFNNR